MFGSSSFLSGKTTGSTMRQGVVGRRATKSKTSFDIPSLAGSNEKDGKKSPINLKSSIKEDESALAKDPSVDGKSTPELDSKKEKLEEDQSPSSQGQPNFPDNSPFHWNNLKSLTSSMAYYNPALHPLLLASNINGSNPAVKMTSFPSGLALSNPALAMTMAPRFPTQMNPSLSQGSLPFVGLNVNPTVADVSKKIEGTGARLGLGDWSSVLEQWQGNFYLNLLIISVQHARAQPPFTMFPKAKQNTVLFSQWYQLLGLHLASFGSFSSAAFMTTVGGSRGESTFTSIQFMRTLANICTQLSLTPTEISFLESLILTRCDTTSEDTEDEKKDTSLKQEQEVLHQKILLSLSFYLSQNFPAQPTRFGNILGMLELLKSPHVRTYFSSFMTPQILKFVIDNF